MDVLELLQDKPDSSKTQRNLKKTLKTYILAEYPAVKKSIPPEIRHWIFSSTSTKHVKSSAKLIYSLKSAHLLCDTNLSHEATHISYKNLSLMCYECSKPETLEQISEKSDKKVKKLFENRKKKENLNSLTKFDYRLPEIVEKKTKTLLVYLKFLYENPIKDLPRCTICRKKLSFGYLTPMRLECTHFSCFTCYLEANNSVCSFCNIIPIAVPSEDYTLPSSLHLNCSGSSQIHSLLSSTSLIFKLPCTHLSCELHKNSSQCGKCRFKYNPDSLPTSPKTRNLIDFLSIHCLLHKKSLKSFNLLTCKGFCESCEQLDSTFLCGDLSLLQPSLYLYLKNVVNNPELSDKVENIEILKRISYCKYLTAQNLYELVRELAFMVEVEYTDVEVVKRFQKTTVDVSRNKLWSPENGKVTKLEFAVYCMRMMVGVLVGGSVYNSALKLSTQSAPSVLIEINQAGVKVFEYLHLKELDQFENEIRFPRPVCLLPDKDYSLILHLSGSFISGVPITRLKTKDIHIKTPSNSLENFGNSSIGGPILGFIFALPH